MSESIYEVVDGEGSVVNIIVLNDPAAWAPPAGHSVRPFVAPESVEPEPADPEPLPLDEAALIDLCQSAGGMTDPMLVAVYKDDQLAAFIIKLRAAKSILPSDDRAIQGLGALDALGYLPDGAAAVLAAWPTR